MDLSRDSITSHQFDLNRRGYDPDAVDAHLREIADAAGSRESEIADLRRTVAELEAKVQDASESEEALRLTLKAAAHAKEELLAGAREQAATLEQEASDRAAKLVADAEARAASLNQDAEARAEAMTRGATERAREVAKAALSESELLVVRIEQLRAQVQAAEDSLRSLSSDAVPALDEARVALDSALEAARASAENPELLAAAVPEPPVAAAPPQQETPQQETPQPVAEMVEAAAPVQPQPEGEPAMQQAVEAEQPEPEAPAQPEPAAAGQDDEGSVEAEQQAPQLEVVEEAPAPAQQEPSESSADISNKVDRLLEELREVT